jgi:cytoskeleton protein RodZ
MARAVPPGTPAVQPAAGSGPAQADAPAQAGPHGNDRPAPTGVASSAAAAAGGEALARADPTADKQLQGEALARADATDDAQTQNDENAIVEPRVLLRAREEAWIQISSPTGDYAFTRTLQPGEVVTVPNRADLELWTGNAGGLDIIVDGTPVPVLAGAVSGAVRRNVSLDPARLLQATRRP